MTVVTDRIPSKSHFGLLVLFLTYSFSFVEENQKEIADCMNDEKLSTEEIKLKLVEKYNLYFALWKDFNILVAILAMVGLLLGMHDWAQSFAIRGEDGKKVRETTNITGWYIFLTTILAIIANFIVFFLNFVWKQYR